MAFDFKKEYKEIYSPKNKAEIITIPEMNYMAIRGTGDPNEVDGMYQNSIKVLYTVAYTLRMSYKSDYKIKGFYKYVVPPLEGFWWQDGVAGVDYSNKQSFNWISVIRLPDFVSKEDFDWAVETASKKKKINCSMLEFIKIDEGLCVQMMHIGPFNDEPKTVSMMDEFIDDLGYQNDFSDRRHHHEVYISDMRKVSPERLKTVIRHPIKKK
ncbi:MAG: GyrI-like domain-containing protein [Peptostreptococcus sp.]|uniref:GyrI-like domain-containing protein n=1 Tax=Peptostreptococcus sp. TaxID=1262 RepID=UPI002FCBFAAE